MGMSIEIEDIDFTIKKENQEAAYRALHTITAMGAEDLKTLLQTWRYKAIFDDEGDIVDLEFLGDKLGDEDQLFASLAPFVEKGFIQFETSEDTHLFYEFKNGAVALREGNAIRTIQWGEAKPLWGPIDPIVAWTAVPRGPGSYEAARRIASQVKS